MGKKIRPNSKSLVATCSKCGKLKIKIFNKGGEKHKKVLEEKKALCRC
jgi:hypothetical protein